MSSEDKQDKELESEEKKLSYNIGNRFWEARSSHGRDPIFKTKEKLWNACLEYFVWAQDNPLFEEKAFHTNGVITKTTISKMRAMTIGGMCNFLDISHETWSNYRKRDDYVGVTKKAEQIIYDQKFSGAAADLLNANIIARDLGLKDASSNEHSGIGGGPIAVANIDKDMDAQKAAEVYLDFMKGVGNKP